MKPKFRILESENGKFLVQSKFIKTWIFWENHNRFFNEIEARSHIKNLISREELKKGYKIKRIIEV